ncbi:spore germination protein [Gracilibacillus halotolerans]|uniref:Spore germination protein n=1 Tax=Gracilibacillus halotolerans TaxID=74386 RepID=A0A841RSY0_9BACI|nr:Ger(x)C family spore germination protein [Gracilibacillus halotolerans]MBB6514315.1 spore germination protein [Gracilibacillus halotolerans]
MQIVKISFIAVVVILLQACLSPSRLEETAIINTRGVDLVEEDGQRFIEATIIPYIFDPEAAESTSLLVGRGTTVKDARTNAEKQSPYPLSPGKINMDFYGEEAAKAGILPFLNTLIRDARVSDRMQLAITTKTAREFLEYKQEITTVNTTEYLQDLTKKEIDLDILPRNTLEYFTRLIRQVGIDPILPILGFHDEKPTITGAALFKEDKYVGEVSLMESFFINQLRKAVNETPLNARVPKENYKDMIAYESEPTEDEEFVYLSLNLSKGKGTIKLDDFDSLSFKADIKMRVELLETSIPMDIKTAETSKRLEKDIEAYYQAEYEKLFEKLQSHNVDSFGLGRKYVATRKGSKTTAKEWYEKYNNATMDFKVNVTIVNYGTID